MIRYTKCPLCSSSDIHPALTFVDYTVSQQPFAVLHCNACTARFTQDIPSQTEIGVYYQADSYVSHTDTHKGLVNRLYHFYQFSIPCFEFSQYREAIDLESTQG